MAGGELPQGLAPASSPTFAALTVTGAETVGTTLGVTGLTTVTGGLLASASAPGAGRGFMVRLGTLLALNLNAVAATTIFTTPGSGFTRCVVDHVNATNSTGAPTTNAISFGAAATPTDWLGATVLAAGFTAGKGIEFNQALNAPFAVYGTSIAFVANVTVGGAAIAADFTVWGYYE